MSHCAGWSNVLVHLERQRGGDKPFQISVKSPVAIKPCFQSTCHSESVSCNGNSECVLACVRAPTFSRSWRSCLPLASLEHRFCSGATTVQMQRPSASWVELYTCHPSFGRMVCIQEQGFRWECKTTDRRTAPIPPGQRHCCPGRVISPLCLIGPSAQSHLVFVFYTKAFYAAAVRLHGLLVGEVPELNKKLFFVGLFS